MSNIPFVKRYEPKTLDEIVGQKPIVTALKRWIGIPSLKLACEYDGNYFHKNLLKDLIRDEEINNAGWGIVHFKEKEKLKNENMLNLLIESPEKFKEQCENN